MRLRYTYLSDGTKSSTSSLSTGSAFRYRYAGKEEQRFGTFDSQLLDFGARYYDPWSCQWTAVDPIAEKYYGMTTYGYCAGNPIKFVDPVGNTFDNALDIAFVAYDLTAAAFNKLKGNDEAAKRHLKDAGSDAVAALIPGYTAAASHLIRGVEKGIDIAKNVERASDAGKAIDKSLTVTENAAKGKAFEAKVSSLLGDKKASQVTIEVKDGTRTKVDFIEFNEGNFTIYEAKSSNTAKLTRNQKTSFPQIEQSGGVVKGNKGLDIGLPTGSEILPTEVKIIRPEDLSAIR